MYDYTKGAPWSAFSLITLLHHTTVAATTHEEYHKVWRQPLLYNQGDKHGPLRPLPSRHHP